MKDNFNKVRLIYSRNGLKLFKSSLYYGHPLFLKKILKWDKAKDNSKSTVKS